MTLPRPATRLLELPSGVQLETLTTGAGDPVTVFAHGLAGGIPDTRPLGSAVTGSRVFFQFRGHGRSIAPGHRWSYLDLAADLRGVADATGADQALGVSLGAAALCRLLADTPDRFRRLVFYLPGTLTEPAGQAGQQRLIELRAALADRDAQRLAAVLGQEQPGTDGWAGRALTLLETGLGAGLTEVLAEPPLTDLGVLAAVRAPALVIACQDDPVHPVESARRLAAALPAASLHVYPRPAPMLTARADLRRRISGFLNATQAAG